MTDRPVFQPGEILRRLVAADVHFVLIGGLASQAHGSPSATFDLDIVPSWNRDNLGRLARVLTDVAAARAGDSAEVGAVPFDVRTLHAGATFNLNTRFGRLDLLASPDPGFDFERLRRSSEQREVLGTRFEIASLDDLIAMKRAAGRPKDRVEVEILGALREEIDREGR